MEDQIITYSSDETERFGESFAVRLKPNDVVLLNGNLGAGKTTFVKGLAKALGVESRIISPTFIIERRHEIISKSRDEKSQKASDIRTLYHLDLYRLENEKELMNIDINEILNDKEGVVVIEWPNLGKNIVNKKTWKLNFENLDNDTRKIIIQYE